MNSPDYLYYKEIFKGKQMPYAFVDLDLLDENLKMVAKRSNGKPIRVASKSVRCLSILKRILDYGFPYKGIMAYSAREAAFLCSYGFDDILLGYPVFHESDLGAALDWVKKGKRIRFMVDSVAQAEQLHKVASERNIVAEYCLDIDMSTDFPALGGLHFGVFRSPLHDVKDVENLVNSVKRFSSAKCVGIMGYEAQVAGVGDDVQGQSVKNKMVRMLKQRSQKDYSKRRGDIVAWLKNNGNEVLIVNAGGTGSLESSSAEPWVTEVTAGSAFYSSGLFDNYLNFRHLPAAAFAVEVIRQPKEKTFTCLGGGYIASGEIGASKQPKPYLPVGVKLVKLEGCGEVQTPIEYNGKDKIQIGDPVFFRHAKAGELCERFNRLSLVKNGKIVDEVNTYRGEGECFL